MCKRCETKPIIKLISGEGLCKTCFFNYFEKKVRKTIRVNNLIGKKENLLVAVSGGKDSLSVLDVLLSIYKGNRNVKISALLIDEGIKGYRENCIETTKKYCKENKVNLVIASFLKEYNFTLDKIVKGRKPCSVCGVLRRSLLNSKARELKATKLITGHNLDDEAQTFLMNIFKGSPQLSANTGPVTRNLPDKKAKFTPRIKPLFYVAENNIKEYSKLKNLPVVYEKCPCALDSYRIQVRKFVNTLTETEKQNIMKNFDSLIKRIEKIKDTRIEYCEVCGEPARNKVCKKCNLVKA